MTTRSPPFVKICCIASLQEAELAMALGADALGLVSAMPSGPGVISDVLVAEIAAAVARKATPSAAVRPTVNSFAVKSFPVNTFPVKTFLLTSRQTAQDIAAQHAVCNTTTLQLVDDVAPEELRLLRRLLPHVELVQVIHVVDELALHQALAVAPWVDMLLLDSGNPRLAVKELGGTGRTHNWEISQRIVAAAPVPVLLAGGLNAQNARASLQNVSPYGLDICSDVRSGGQLDAEKLAAFMQAVKT